MSGSVTILEFVIDVASDWLIITGFSLMPNLIHQRSLSNIKTVANLCELGVCKMTLFFVMRIRMKVPLFILMLYLDNKTIVL